MKRFLRKCGSEAGNVTVIFAIAIIPLLLAAGVAVDMLRINQVKVMLQAAADAAALGGGASSRPTEAEVVQIAQSYIDRSNTAEVVSELKDTQIINDTANGKFTVKLTGVMPTSFMRLAGVSSVDVSVMSEVVKGGGAPLELALALDVTASMAGSKIDTLKIAAKNMVDKVMGASSNAKVGMVPFNIYANVGIDKKGESWLTVGNEYDAQQCYDTYPNRTGCTMNTGTCDNDGTPYECSYETCTSMGDPVPSCSMVQYRFAGCVASRQPPLNARADSVNTDPYLGMINTWCAQPLTDLTDVKSEIVTAIDNLYTNQATFIPAGLLWAWNLLTPEEPFTRGRTKADMAAARGKKALVLMTDGANTLQEGSYMGIDGIHWGCSDTECTVTNTLTADLCTNIKADGILLYTVLFDVTDPTIENLMRNCASDPSMSYVASDNAALLAAFDGIGSSLSQLRLSR